MKCLEAHNTIRTSIEKINRCGETQHILQPLFQLPILISLHFKIPHSFFQTYASAVSRQALSSHWELPCVAITASSSPPCIRPTFGPSVYMELENSLQIPKVLWRTITRS